MLRKFRSAAAALLLAGTAILPASAQTKIGDTPAVLTPSAELEVNSTTRGFLPPRMLQAQMNAIVSPATGLIVYCLNCTPAGLRVFDGTVWSTICANNNPVATFAPNTLSCSGTLAGTYVQGAATTGSNTKGLTITSSTGGNYTASTNTVNGVTFVATGTIFTTGAGTAITLVANGTPAAAGTFTYIAALDGQTCSFPVTYVPAGPPAPSALITCSNATNTFSPVGPLLNSTSYSGTYTLPYSNGNGTAYAATALTQNGLTLTRSVGTYAPGTGSIAYTLTGTYSGSANTEVFTIAEGCEVVLGSRYVTTFAGLTDSAGSTDGTGTAARFNAPAGIAIDTAGNFYVGDYYNNVIRKITPAGVVTTLAGSVGNTGSTDGTGSAASFNGTLDLAVAASGDVYVADAGNYTIRKITPAGVVTTVAGSPGLSGIADGTGSNARFGVTRGVAVDAAGNVYVCDIFNNTIRKITPAGVVTTLAGSAGSQGTTNGMGSAARFSNPSGIVVDATGNLYVTDGANFTIRKITPAGMVTTLAGNGGYGGSADGTGSAARFYFPVGIALDTAGNLYVADQPNHTIRRVTPAGVVTTIAGSAGNTGSANGAGNAARFYYPYGIASDKLGNLYVTDQYNHTIRKISP